MTSWRARPSHKGADDRRDLRAARARAPSAADQVRAEPDAWQTAFDEIDRRAGRADRQLTLRKRVRTNDRRNTAPSEEVAGPLMVVDQVEGVTYDELGEIELPRRRRSAAARCWRSTATTRRRAAVRELRGHQPARLARSASWATALQLGVSEDMLGRVFDGMGQPIDGGPEHAGREVSRHRRPAHQPRRARLPRRSSSRRASPRLTV